jgi:hypothetical protein
MIFYDTVLNDNLWDDFDRLPECVKNKVGNILVELKSSNNLDKLWELVESICKEYIDIKLINDLEINKEELLEDMKFQIIFNIYLSLRNGNEKKSIRECANKYYLDLNDKEDFESIFESLKNNFVGWNYINRDNCEYYDFFKLFYKNITNCNRKILSETDFNNIAVSIYPNIFCLIIDNWNTCPYNFKNLKGMNFDRLFRFYNKMKVIVESSRTKLDKTVNAYAIERIFKFSYIYKLIKYMGNLYTEKIKKVFRDDIEDVGIILAYPEKYNKDVDYIYDSMCELPYNYRNNLGFVIRTLSIISSSPLVFSRDKYIEIINEIIVNKIKDGNIGIRIELFFKYINFYILPIMSIVYKYLIAYFTNRNKISERDFVEEYILKNLEMYDYKKFNIKDKGIKLGDDKIRGIIRNNLYEEVYKSQYVYDTIDQFKESRDILEDMEKMYKAYFKY